MSLHAHHRSPPGDHRITPATFVGMLTSVVAVGAVVHGLWVALVPMMVMALVGDIFRD